MHHPPPLVLLLSVGEADLTDGFRVQRQDAFVCGGMTQPQKAFVKRHLIHGDLSSQDDYGAPRAGLTVWERLAVLASTNPGPRYRVTIRSAQKSH